MTITRTGLLYDRSFVLIVEPADPSTTTAEHLTIKTTSQLCLFQQSISKDHQTLTITHKLTKKSLSVRLSPPPSVPLSPTPSSLADAPSYFVSIFKSTLTGRSMGTPASNFFTVQLPHLAPSRVLLLYVGDTGSRPIPAQSFIPSRPRTLPWFLSYLAYIPLPPGVPGLLAYLFKPSRHPADQIKAHDGAPILLTTTASEDDAVSRWPDFFPEKHEQGVTITRFRSNIHVATPEGTPAYDEDRGLKAIITPNPPSPPQQSTNRVPVVLDIVFHTIRCQSLNVDLLTGVKMPNKNQIYKHLLRDRCVNRTNPKFRYTPCFGRYCFGEPMGGVVRVGDGFEVLERSDSKP